MGRSFQLGRLGGGNEQWTKMISLLNKIAELVNTISFKIKQIPKPVLMEADGGLLVPGGQICIVAVDFCLATDKAKSFAFVEDWRQTPGIHLLDEVSGQHGCTTAMTGQF